MEDLTHDFPDALLDQYANSLVEVPIDNERYVARFSRENRRSGSVTFHDKKSDRTAEAQWRVYRDGDTVRARLTYNGFLLFDEDHEQYRVRISRRLLVF